MVSESSTDQELVSAFLAAIGKSPTRKVGRDVMGISADDVSRWRRGRWEYLTGEKREAILRFLTASSESEVEEEEDAALEMVEVWQRIDAVNADPSLSEVVRLMRVEQLLAAGRMALQHKETRLARGRERIIEREIDAAERRTLAVEREGERADARLSLYVEDGESTPTPRLSDEELAALRQSGRRASRTQAARQRKPAAGESPPNG